MFSHTKDVTFFLVFSSQQKKIKSMCLSFNYIGARIELKCHLGKCVLFGYRRRKDAPHCTFFLHLSVIERTLNCTTETVDKTLVFTFLPTYTYFNANIISKNLNDSDSRENFTISPL